MPASPTHAVPASTAAILAAARRVVAARANPKLDWGQSKAMQEESNAFDELAKCVAAHDKALGANETTDAEEETPPTRKAGPVHIELFNISAAGHKLIAVDGEYDTLVEGDLAYVLRPSIATIYAKESGCRVSDLLITCYDLYGNTPARKSVRVGHMSIEEARALVRKCKVKPSPFKKAWTSL